MAERRLSAEERVLCAKVTAGMRRLAPAATDAEAVARVTPGPSGPVASVAAPPAAPAPRPIPKRAAVGDTLDGGWDRRLSRGLVSPEMTVDLHGYGLSQAHAVLDHALAQAAARGARVLLVITGRPPREREAPYRRGLIRAAIGDWLALSPHASRIAAVRRAHQRHGGAGALYIVLRRARD